MERKTFNIRVNPEIYREFKSLAVKKDITLSVALEEALAAWTQLNTGDQPDPIVEKKRKK